MLPNAQRWIGWDWFQSDSNVPRLHSSAPLHIPTRTSLDSVTDQTLCDGLFQTLLLLKPTSEKKGSCPKSSGTDSHLTDRKSCIGLIPLSGGTTLHNPDSRGDKSTNRDAFA